MLVNTNEFRREALFFKKHGRYDDGIAGSNTWKQYWQEQQHRCLNGYSVGGQKITGNYYFYLNFCPILLTEEVHRDGVDNDKGGAIEADRIKAFPRFWDLDLEYFNAVDLAKSKGKHLIILKPRGIGASFKGASLLARNYFLVPDSRNYAIANEKEYLLKDGIYTKAMEYVNFIDKNTAYTKRRDFVNSVSSMHIRASFDRGNRIEDGYMSEIIGVSLKNDHQKARGKRGKIILWEEAGKFPNLEKAWQIARPSVEEGRTVFGTMIAFGTGGTEGADYRALESMFYNPDAYNIEPFENLWDEGLIGTNCGLFFPATYGIDFADSEGNTNHESAMEWLNEEFESAKAASDPTLLDQKKAEYPLTPQDAMLNTTSNRFPVYEAKKQKAWLLSEGKASYMGTAGILEKSKDGVKFKPSDSVKPVTKFPHNRSEDNTGAVVVYQAPFKLNGEIPDNLYIICVDPYAHDQTVGASLGSAYVIKNPNDVSYPDDYIAASYVGRPPKQDDFASNVSMLADYYNAKICFESDRGEAFLAWFKQHRRLDQLAKELEFHHNENIPKSSLRKGFGVAMSSGRNNEKILQADGYLADWFTRGRGLDEDGNQIMNIHKIYDLALLEEIIKYGDGNFDRLSALRVGMYFQKEVMFEEVVMKKKSRKKRKLFSTNLYNT